MIKLNELLLLTLYNSLNGKRCDIQSVSSCDIERLNSIMMYYVIRSYFPFYNIKPLEQTILHNRTLVMETIVVELLVKKNAKIV